MDFQAAIITANEQKSKKSKNKKLFIFLFIYTICVSPGERIWTQFSCVLSRHLFTEFQVHNILTYIKETI